MYPVAFDYVRVDSVRAAAGLLREAAGGGRLLAGGHSLVPLLKLRLALPQVLIDISEVPELRGAAVAGDEVEIRAATTWRELVRDPALAEAAPLVGETAAVIGDPQVRARGTIGGSVAHADPAADMPAALLALDATLVVEGAGGSRRVPMAEFVAGAFETDLREDEVLTRVLLPRPGSGAGAAYAKFEHPASHLALCGVAALVELAGDGRVGRARLGVTGACATPLRARAAEERLQGERPEPALLDEAAGLAATGLEPLSDIHADARYRAHLTRLLARRALATAVRRCGKEAP